jgi:hypothetical protein
MIRLMIVFLCAMACHGSLLGAPTSPSAETTKAGPPNIRSRRPRVFLRADEWDGPYVIRLREWFKRPEYQKRLYALPTTTIGNALLYAVNHDAEAGKRAVKEMTGLKISGTSPSYTGIQTQKIAAVHDWLHDFEGYDAETRKKVIAILEEWGDRYVKYLESDEDGVTPFYSRMPGAIAGLTAIGLSLHGDHPKADGYIRFAYDFLRTKIGTVREVEDGASGGGSYSFHHSFTDLANLAAAWRSATDWDAADWIAKNQGDWQRRQAIFHLWWTDPEGQFVKEGDIKSGGHDDGEKYSMHLVTIMSMYRMGTLRTYLDNMRMREGIGDFDSEFVWEWFVFNDPTIPPEPLTKLGRVEVFSPRLHGYVCWRNGWEPDDIRIWFKSGDTVDFHRTQDQGKFIIYRNSPLAIKNGLYNSEQGYESKHHWYFRSPWSANSVVFSGPGHDGQQPFVNFDGTPSWKQWKARRDEDYEHPPTGILMETESNDAFAYAKGDLSGATRGSTWIRELVFLDYKYLLVLDRVTAAPGIRHRWLLQTMHRPKVTGDLVVADNGKGRLFVKTLLPLGATLTRVGGAGSEFLFNGENVPPEKWTYENFSPPEEWIYDPDKDSGNYPAEKRLGSWRMEVTPADDAAETVYLHVLYPTDTGTRQMPTTQLEREGGRLTVIVDGLSYSFE